MTCFNHFYDSQLLRHQATKNMGWKEAEKEHHQG